MRRDWLILAALSGLALSAWWVQRPSRLLPAPSERVRGESDGFAQRRAQWIEHLHRHAPDLDWRAQDAHTLAQLHPRRAARVAKMKQRQMADAQAGAPAGTWIERGANNWAGRVSALDYDAVTDHLTVFAHGGQLWRSTLAALDWRPLNDARHFEPENTMQHFARLSGSPERWLVADDTRHGFYYSDDQGATWTPSGGFVPDNWFQTYYLVARDVVGHQVYALVEDYNFTAKTYQERLLVSSDRGANFSDLGFVGAPRQVALFAPGQGSNLVYLLKGSVLNRIESGNAITPLATLVGAPTQTSDDNVGLAGGIASGTPFLYAFFEANKKTSVLRSLDGGSNWYARGSIADVSLLRMAAGTDLRDPNYVFFGTTDLWRSVDGGATFSANDWADYYPNPMHKLHADISFVRSYVDAQGNDLLFIGTDGGLFESTDHGATVTNLNPTGMRQGQYYDSYTQRMPPYAIAVGAQDQGYQRNSHPAGGILDFDQVVSGDYAHLTSSDGGATIWSNYAGFSQVDPAPANAQSTILPEWSFSDDGKLQNVLFLPPLLADPINPRVAWLAGGSATKGLNHVVQLSWNGNLAYSGAITGVEGSFDFGDQVTALASGGGEYYAMANAGDNAAFFRTATPLAAWTRSAAALPQGQFFYGNDIAVNEQSGQIYICGSGYSGPAVYVSTDDGATFVPMANGLPNTLVYNLALSPDGSLLFAATEVGPFYYNQADATWVDIGAGAPDNIYWGVDYIPALNVARFSTYGRGLWDYAMNSNASVTAYPAASSTKPCGNDQQCLRTGGPYAH